MPKHTYNPRRNSVADIERVALLRISTANIADCRSLDQPSWLASNSLPRDVLTVVGGYCS